MFFLRKPCAHCLSLFIYIFEKVIVACAFLTMALIFDRIGWVSCQPLEKKYRLQGFRHYVVTGAEGVITEGGEDFDCLVSKKWTREVRSQCLSVVLKGSVHKLMPGFKIERGLLPHHYSEAFGVVEKLFLKKMRDGCGEDPQSVHLDILDGYPSRLAKNDYFRPLNETGFEPNYK